MTTAVGRGRNGSSRRAMSGRALRGVAAIVGAVALCGVGIGAAAADGPAGVRVTVVDAGGAPVVGADVTVNLVSFDEGDPVGGRSWHEATDGDGVAMIPGQVDPSDAEEAGYLPAHDDYLVTVVPPVGSGLRDGRWPSDENGVVTGFGYALDTLVEARVVLQPTPLPPTDLRIAISCSGSSPTAVLSFAVDASTGTDLDGDGTRYYGPIEFTLNGDVQWWGDTMTFPVGQRAQVPLVLPDDTNPPVLKEGDVVAAAVDVAAGEDPSSVPTNASATVHCAGATASPSPSASASPSASSGQGPSPVLSTALTGANRGTLDAPSSAIAGAAVTVSLGAGEAGQQVWSWIYSSPTSLGTQTVAANGTIRLTIPGNLPAGTHTIAVQNRAGAVIGWDTLRVSAANAIPGGATGLDEGAGAGLPTAALVVLGVVLALAAAGLTLARRRTTTG